MSFAALLSEQIGMRMWRTCNVPKLSVRKLADVPASIHTNKAILEQQKLYEDFIAQASGNVGELTLDADEVVRSIKVRVRRAATRMGTKLDIWEADGKVYFRAEEPSKRRVRPRKTA